MLQTLRTMRAGQETEFDIANSPYDGFSPVFVRANNLAIDCYLALGASFVGSSIAQKSGKFLFPALLCYTEQEHYAQTVLR